MSFLLRVWDGSTEFSYNASVVADNEFEVQISSDSEAVEAGDMTLELGPSFLGFEDFFSLPAGPWRAEVSFEYVDATAGNRVMLNGSIIRDNCAFLDLEKTWVITVVDDSVDQALERIETINFQDPAGPTALSVPTQEVDSDGGWVENTVQWWNVQEGFEAIVEEAGTLFLNYQDAPVWLTLDVVYVDGTDKTISRTLPFYIYEGGQPSQKPNITGGQLFDILHQMLGWRIQANYVAFPGDYIEITILSDYFIEPAANASALDALVARDGYSFGFETAQQPDFAIAYRNKVGEEELNAGAVVPVQLSIYAGNRQELSADGEPQNQNLRKVSVSLPHAKSVSTTSAITPDPTNHPNYDETLQIGTPVTQSSQEIYIGTFYDDGGTQKFIVNRNPINPATGQITQLAEYWAVNLIEQFQLTRSSLYRAEGGFRLHDLLQTEFGVGDPLLGLRLKDRHWMIRNMGIGFESTVASLELVNLEATPNVVVTIPVICPPGPITIVRLTPGEDPQFLLEWTPPEGTCGQQLPASYDVSVITPDQVSSAPQFLGNTSDLFYDTGLLLSGGYGTYIFMVQSLTAGGEKSQGRFASFINEEDEILP